MMSKPIRLANIDKVILYIMGSIINKKLVLWSGSIAYGSMILCRPIKYVYSIYYRPRPGLYEI